MTEESMLVIEMTKWVKENNPKYFYELWHYALANRTDWANLLRKKNYNYGAKEYIRSYNRIKRKSKS